MHSVTRPLAVIGDQSDTARAAAYRYYSCSMQISRARLWLTTDLLEHDIVDLCIDLDPVYDLVFYLFCTVY
eukprot:SAG11_NODE_6670_length_1270_cov_1.642186_1_plen_70_part_10